MDSIFGNDFISQTAFEPDSYEEFNKLNYQVKRLKRTLKCKEEVALTKAITKFDKAMAKFSKLKFDDIKKFLEIISESKMMTDFQVAFKNLQQNLQSTTKLSPQLAKVATLIRLSQKESVDYSKPYIRYQDRLINLTKEEYMDLNVISTNLRAVDKYFGKEEETSATIIFDYRVLP